MALSRLGNGFRGLLNFFTLGAIKDLHYKGGPRFFDYVDSLLNKYTGAGLTGAEEEANDFTHNERIEAQDFEHNEAVLAYERQKDFYENYQSYQAQVRQMTDAGLNPALMYGRGASPASPISSSAPSSSGGSSVSPQGGNIFSAISDLVGLSIRSKEAKADIALKESEAFANRTRANLIQKQVDNFENEWNLKRELGNATIDDVNSNIAYRVSATALNNANITKAEAETALTNWQSQLASIDVRYKPLLNDSLLDLQAVSRGKSIAETKLLYAQTDSEKQRYKEQLDTYDARLDKLSAEVYSAFAEAGIKGNELEFWKDQKALEALGIQAEAISKLRFKGPLGIDFLNTGLANSLGTMNGMEFSSLNPYLNYNQSIGMDTPTITSSHWTDIFDTYGGYSDRINSHKGWRKRFNSWRESNFNVGNNSSGRSYPYHH